MTSEPDLVSRIREVRHELARLGPPRVRREGDFERVALPHEEGDVLRDLLVAEDARVVIEIGLAYGSSSLAIAEALSSVSAESPTHVIVDAYQHRFDHAGWEVIRRAGLDGVCTLVDERSQLALPRLVSDGLIAHAAFIDGSHVFHNVFVDLYFVWHVVRPGGLVVLDDCDWPSVATAVRYYELNCGWQREPIDRSTRLRAYRLPNPRVEPGFESFEPFGGDARQPPSVDR